MHAVHGRAARTLAPLVLLRCSHATRPPQTELYVLKRMAPHGSFTDDGCEWLLVVAMSRHAHTHLAVVYVRVPAKFIDFTRSAKARDASADGEEAELKRRGIRSKKRGA